jgi:hypothetical protein
MPTVEEESLESNPWVDPISMLASGIGGAFGRGAGALMRGLKWVGGDLGIGAGMSAAEDSPGGLVSASALPVIGMIAKHDVPRFNVILKSVMRNPYDAYPYSTASKILMNENRAKMGEALLHDDPHLANLKRYGVYLKDKIGEGKQAAESMAAWRRGDYD